VYKQRRRFKQMESLQVRLAIFAKEAREKASCLPPGIEKDDMMRKASQADTAAHIDEWARDCNRQGRHLSGCH